MLSDNVRELIQLVPCNSEILLLFDASRVTILGEINKIGQDFDIIEYFGTENLNFRPLVISKAPHNGLRSGNVRADTKFDASYCAKVPIMRSFAR